MGVCRTVIIPDFSESPKILWVHDIYSDDDGWAVIREKPALGDFLEMDCLRSI